jgi:hypothetical protein
MLIVEVNPGDVVLSRLDGPQADARAGAYAQAMAGFVRSLAPRYEQVQADLQERVAALRSKWASQGGHPRTVSMMAELFVGARYLLDYAMSIDAITPAEHAAYLVRFERALREAGGAQTDHQQAANPAQLYIDMLRAALTSGRAHLAGMNGGRPLDAERWGWRRDADYVEPTTQGVRIGWTDGENVYLESAAAFGVAKAMARSVGENVPFGEKAMNRELARAGVLAEADPGGHTVRRDIEGVRRRVLHLDAASLVEVGRPLALQVVGTAWLTVTPGGAAQRVA